jgi:hypothetical protein
MAGTDKGRASPTATRLGVDEYNDSAYSPLSVTRNDSYSHTVLCHHDSGLPCSGIARTSPRALVYAPIKYQGLGIPNLYISEGTSHIERILKYRHLDDDITGQVVRASVEQLKLEIGCNEPTLSLPCDHFSKLATQCWIRTTGQLMDKYQIRIEDTSSC